MTNTSNPSPSAVHSSLPLRHLADELLGVLFAAIGYFLLLPLTCVASIVVFAFWTPKDQIPAWIACVAYLAPLLPIIPASLSLKSRSMLVTAIIYALTCLILDQCLPNFQPPLM